MNEFEASLERNARCTKIFWRRNGDVTNEIV